MPRDKKLYIATSRPIGEECRRWAIAQNKYNIVDDMEDCNIFISILYDKLLPQSFLDNRSAYNFHPGILPHYRGAGACSWVLINKECEHGVTLHEMTAGIDCGNIIHIERFPILEQDTAETLFIKSERAIMNTFTQFLSKIYNYQCETILDGNNNFPLYSRDKLNKAKDLTHIVRAFTFWGKERAYYYTRDGRRVDLDYANGPSY
jgi:methionyl-tRNA formyltransferase